MPDCLFCTGIGVIYWTVSSIVVMVLLLDYLFGTGTGFYTGRFLWYWYWFIDRAISSVMVLGNLPDDCLCIGSGSFSKLFTVLLLVL
jgi:hypothetical protein